MIAIVRERLRTGRAAGFVLDGFPRTVAQARALDDHGGARNGPLIVVDVGAGAGAGAAAGGPADLLERAGPTPTRSTAATACGKCGGELVQRTDDDQDVVLERLKVYQRVRRSRWSSTTVSGRRSAW